MAAEARRPSQPLHESPHLPVMPRGPHYSFNATYLTPEIAARYGYTNNLLARDTEAANRFNFVYTAVHERDGRHLREWAGHIATDIAALAKSDGYSSTGDILIGGEQVHIFPVALTGHIKDKVWETGQTAVQSVLDAPIGWHNVIHDISRSNDPAVLVRSAKAMVDGVLAAYQQIPTDNNTAHNIDQQNVIHTLLNIISDGPLYASEDDTSGINPLMAKLGRIGKTSYTAEEVVKHLFKQAGAVIPAKVMGTWESSPDGQLGSFTVKSPEKRMIGQQLITLAQAHSLSKAEQELRGVSSSVVDMEDRLERAKTRLKTEPNHETSQKRVGGLPSLIVLGRSQVDSKMMTYEQSVRDRAMAGAQEFESDFKRVSVLTDLNLNDATLTKKYGKKFETSDPTEIRRLLCEDADKALAQNMIADMRVFGPRSLLQMAQTCDDVEVKAQYDTAVQKRGARKLGGQGSFHECAYATGMWDITELADISLAGRSHLGRALSTVLKTPTATFSTGDKFSPLGILTYEPSFLETVGPTPAPLPGLCDPARFGLPQASESHLNTLHAHYTMRIGRKVHDLAALATRHYDASNRNGQAHKLQDIAATYMLDAAYKCMYTPGEFGLEVKGGMFEAVAQSAIDVLLVDDQARLSPVMKEAALQSLHILAMTSDAGPEYQTAIKRAIDHWTAKVGKNPELLDTSDVVGFATTIAKPHPQDRLPYGQPESGKRAANTYMVEQIGGILTDVAIQADIAGEPGNTRFAGGRIDLMTYLARCGTPSFGNQEIRMFGNYQRRLTTGGNGLDANDYGAIADMVVDILPHQIDNQVILKAKVAATGTVILTATDINTLADLFVQCGQVLREPLNIEATGIRKLTQAAYFIGGDTAVQTCNTALSKALQGEVDHRVTNHQPTEVQTARRPQESHALDITQVKNTLSHIETIRAQLDSVATQNPLVAQLSGEIATLSAMVQGSVQPNTSVAELATRLVQSLAQQSLSTISEQTPTESTVSPQDLIVQQLVANLPHTEDRRVMLGDALSEEGAVTQLLKSALAGEVIASTSARALITALMPTWRQRLEVNQDRTRALIRGDGERAAFDRDITTALTGGFGALTEALRVQAESTAQTHLVYARHDAAQGARDNAKIEHDIYKLLLARAVDIAKQGAGRIGLRLSVQL